MKTITLLLCLLALLSTACTPSDDSPLPDDTSGQTPNPNPDPQPEPGPNPDPEPPIPTPNFETYIPKGVGGGGAMSGVAISPYSNLWFVGTDMGTLFRSTDLGKSWRAVNHLEAVFDSELTRSVSPGFSSDGITVFHASKGLNPKRSLDGGNTFHKINMGLANDEYIKYWHSHSSNSSLIFAGTNKGLLRSTDKGQTWSRASGIINEAIGSFIDSATGKFYHATPDGIWESTNNAQSFTKSYTPSGIKLRQFSGGRDSAGLTLTFADNDGNNACSWVYSYSDWGQTSIDNTLNTCGYVWLSNDGRNYRKTIQAVGDHLKMAENDSRTIYSTGGRKWIRQYGTKIYISTDGGNNWDLKLHQMNWDVSPYAPWSRDKLEYSAVALDVGWWDDGYESFDVNRRDSKIAAGSGYFFLHSTLTRGDKWLSPFTEYKDTGIAEKGKRWQTRGIEVISIYRMKYHPSNSQLLYAASADIGGVISEDGGNSFRVSKAGFNSNYDYAFDHRDDDIVYAASGNSHDWPNDWHANSIKNAGGIYKSTNRGKSWKRLTPYSGDLDRQFLSVGFDPTRNYIYGGSHETGIIRSTDDGMTWSYLNNGLPSGTKIIPQIEVDPRTGNVYALLTGNAPTFSNNERTGIYFLNVAGGSTTWTLLRGNVHYPSDADKGYKLWYYPTAFAIDFDRPQNLWMVDYENNRNWLMTGIWKSTDGGQNWKRAKQLTHPTDIKIDPTDPDKIYASGYYTLDGSWGDGGQYHSADGGETWIKNTKPTLQQNARSVLIDPVNPANLMYSYFGGGMLQGPNPAY